MTRTICISSGHGLYIRGASGPEPYGIDEVDEARKVVEATAELMRERGVDVLTYHDDVSTTQDENLHRIVDWHNSQIRSLDVSCHFNCYNTTAHGTEVLYVNEDVLAEDLSAVIADALGITNRGPKYRSDLFFLNQTSEPAVLLEICFCDHEGDCGAYEDEFEELCDGIADVIAGPGKAERPPVEPAPRPVRPELPEGAVTFAGPCSWFGGPSDTGVSPSEGLAFIYELDDAPGLFLPQQPPGTTGLARRLDPSKFYIACRWDYAVTPKEMLDDQDKQALVRAKKNGRTTLAHPADWGPHEDTGRAADLSPALLEALGLETDDEVDVLYPIVAARTV